MAVHIEEMYRVKYFLDTNILVDLMGGKYPNLNVVMEFFANCPFVDLHSSMYVLYEFAEVRKYELFLAKLKKNLANAGDYSKARIKSNWKVCGQDYSVYKDEIEQQVRDDIKKLENDFDINFEEHPLREEIIRPAMSLFLTTHISKEDALVLLSCVSPNRRESITGMNIVTHDKGFFHASQQDKETINSLFQQENLEVPTVINTHTYISVTKGYPINLYKSSLTDHIEDTLRRKILLRIKEQKKSEFVGYTKKLGNSGNAAKCICFVSSRDESINLADDVILTIIPQSLDCVTYEIPQGISFWKNKAEGKDMIISKGDCISFIDESIDDVTLLRLRKTGNLVFIERY